MSQDPVLAGFCIVLNGAVVFFCCGGTPCRAPCVTDVQWATSRHCVWESNGVKRNTQHRPGCSCQRLRQGLGQRLLTWLADRLFGGSTAIKVSCCCCEAFNWRLWDTEMWCEFSQAQWESPSWGISDWRVAVTGVVVVVAIYPFLIHPFIIFTHSSYSPLHPFSRIISSSSVVNIHIFQRFYSLFLQLNRLPTQLSPCPCWRFEPYLSF